MENENTPWYKNWKIVTPIGVAIVVVIGLVIGLSVGLTAGKGGSKSKVNSEYSLDGEKIDSINFDLKELSSDYTEVSGNVEVSAYTNIDINDFGDQESYFIKASIEGKDISVTSTFKDGEVDEETKYSTDYYFKEVYAVYDTNSNNLFSGYLWNIKDIEIEFNDFIDNEKYEEKYEEFSTEIVKIANLKDLGEVLNYQTLYIGEIYNNDFGDESTSGNYYKEFISGDIDSENFSAVKEHLSNLSSNLGTPEDEDGWDGVWYLGDNTFNFEYLIS